MKIDIEKLDDMDPRESSYSNVALALVAKGVREIRDILTAGTLLGAVGIAVLINGGCSQPQDVPQPVPSVGATEIVNENPELAVVIREMREENGELLEQNRVLMEVIDSNNAELDSLDIELREAREALAAVESVGEQEAVAVTTRPVPPTPAPQVAEEWQDPYWQTYPFNCTSPYGTYTVCESKEGEYICRDDVTPDCGPYYLGGSEW